MQEEYKMIKALKTYCPKCGKEAGYDIAHRTYRCTACGETVSIAGARDAAEAELLRHVPKRAKDAEIEEYVCQECGAVTVHRKADAPQTCILCGKPVNRRKLTDADKTAQAVLPFTISSEEAKQRLLTWAEKNPKISEAGLIRANIEHLQGCYLPYRLAAGPLDAAITRENNYRTYHCSGYLEGVAVSVSSQLNEAVMNRIAPFDWSQVQAYDDEILKDHPLMLSDHRDKEINEKIRTEAAADMASQAGKVLGMDELHAEVNMTDVRTVSALVPVYFIHTEDITAAVNGQTGKIAVTDEKKKESSLWMAEPLTYTLVLGLLFAWIMDFEPQSTLIGFGVLGLVFFSTMGKDRKSLFSKYILQTDAVRTDTGGTPEPENILKDPFGSTPVFYENEDGKRVPVRISFYSAGRWIQVILTNLLIIVLPLIIAGITGRIQGTEAFKPFNGLAWYVLAGAAALFYITRGFRHDVYELPYLHALKEDGTETLLGKASDRRLGIFGMIGAGSVDKEGKRMNIIKALGTYGIAGYFLGFGVLAVLAVSVMLILR